MKRYAPFAALSLCLTVSAAGQQPTFPDPANLRGERVSPRTGRELAIDRPEAEGGRGLEQILRKLTTRASLMLIVAHPDDEDGGMLTFLSRGLGARVADLSLTRGEGGQNAMTGDFEDALGLIRTQELLSSDRYTDVDQFFGTEVDFGFSKTKKEAFAKWTHERVLYDAVRAVRLYRPLVIAAVFIGGVTDGHGQHQVSGEIAQEVFKAAGDPSVFPELTAEGILPWQPLKVYARVPAFAITARGLFDYATNQYTPARFTNYVTGEVTTTPPSVDVVVHEGETDPLLSAPGEPARSYVQFARIGLGLQKTQIGPGVRLAAPGVFDIGYHRYGSRLPHQPEHETSFFDGIDTSIEGIGRAYPGVVPAEGLARLGTELETIRREFQPAQPGASAPALAEALKGVDALIAEAGRSHAEGLTVASALHELRVKRVQLNDALALALGLQWKAESQGSDLLAGSAVEVPTQLVAAAPGAAMSDESLSTRSALGVAEGTARGGGVALLPGRPLNRPLRLDAAQTGTLTEPYFFRTDIEQPVYQLRDPALRNAPQTPPAMTAWAAVRYRGIEVRVGHVVTDGEQPVSFVPPYSLTLGAPAEVLPEPRHVARIVAAAHSTTAPAPPSTLPLSIQGGAVPVRITAARVPGETEALVPLPAGAASSTLTATLGARGESIAQGFRAVGYPGLPLTNFYTPATERIVPVALALPAHRRIGYLPGTGDAVPAALASVGLPVTMLRVSDLTAPRLAGFDTVILGVRTYNAHPDLHGGPTQALLNFARGGGNVVVQYQTGEFTGADAPYPLTLGTAEKVVEETDPVRLLDPSAPLFTAPNRITTADFNGWIEERGHGFLGTWDPHYTALMETHDPGQAPQKGGLITTQLGNGHWTYCAFALYRQLPEAVPGAFRLFVNLIGLADGPP